MAGRGDCWPPYGAAIGLAQVAIERYDWFSGRCILSGLGEPLAMSARHLLSTLYTLLIEGADSEGIEKLDHELEGTRPVAENQGNRLAAIIAIGGAVGTA